MAGVYVTHASKQKKICNRRLGFSSISGEINSKLPGRASEVYSIKLETHGPVTPQIKKRFLNNMRKVSAWCAIVVPTVLHAWCSFTYFIHRLISL